MTPVIELKQKQFIEKDSEAVRFQVYTARQFDKIEALKNLTDEQRFEMRVVANVLPFRVNQYVIDELLEKIPDFKKAYLEDALSVDEFEDYGPVTLFRNMFKKGWEGLVRVIAEHRS